MSLGYSMKKTNFQLITLTLLFLNLLLPTFAIEKIVEFDGNIYHEIILKDLLDEMTIKNLWGYDSKTTAEELTLRVSIQNIDNFPSEGVIPVVNGSVFISNPNCSFHLFPNEKIIYENDQVSTYISHEISVTERGKKDLFYESPYPIYKVINKTADKLLIQDFSEAETLFPEEEWIVTNKEVFQICSNFKI